MLNVLLAKRCKVVFLHFAPCNLQNSGNHKCADLNRSSSFFVSPSSRSWFFVLFLVTSTVTWRDHLGWKNTHQLDYLDIKTITCLQTSRGMAQGREDWTESFIKRVTCSARIAELQFWSSGQLLGITAWNQSAENQQEDIKPMLSVPALPSHSHACTSQKQFLIQVITKIHSGKKYAPRHFQNYMLCHTSQGSEWQQPFYGQIWLFLNFFFFSCCASNTGLSPPRTQTG